MKKIRKIVNLVLIFMFTWIMLFPGFIYAVSCKAVYDLRLPLNSSIERQKTIQSIEGNSDRIKTAPKLLTRGGEFNVRLFKKIVNDTARKVMDTYDKPVDIETWVFGDVNYLRDENGFFPIDKIRQYKEDLDVYVLTDLGINDVDKIYEVFKKKLLENVISEGFELNPKELDLFVMNYGKKVDAVDYFARLQYERLQYNLKRRFEYYFGGQETYSRSSYAALNFLHGYFEMAYYIGEEDDVIIGNKDLRHELTRLDLADEEMLQLAGMIIESKKRIKYLVSVLKEDFSVLPLNVKCRIKERIIKDRNECRAFVENQRSVIEKVRDIDLQLRVDM